LSGSLFACRTSFSQSRMGRAGVSKLPAGETRLVLALLAFLHPAGVRVTLSGRPGDDAKRYQEQEVALRIAATRTAKGGRK